MRTYLEAIAASGVATHLANGPGLEILLTTLGERPVPMPVSDGRFGQGGLADGLAHVVAGEARPHVVAPGPLRTLPTLDEILAAHAGVFDDRVHADERPRLPSGMRGATVSFARAW